jgi:hypothetical protein
MRWMRERVIFICTEVLPRLVQMCLHLYQGVSPPGTNVGTFVLGLAPSGTNFAYGALWGPIIPT